MDEKNEYKGLMIDDHGTSTHTLFERITEGKGLECSIITEWDVVGKSYRKLADNRIRLVIFAIRIDRKKYKLLIDGYVFGDLPVGLKSGEYQLAFNRYTICEELPEEMFDDDDSVFISPSDLCEPVQL